MLLDKGRRAVAVAASWLDEHRPGWAAAIDVDRLRMGDPDLCILGQAYRGMAAATGREGVESDFGFALRVAGAIHVSCSPLCAGVGVFSSEDTRDVWAEEIAARIVTMSSAPGVAEKDVAAEDVVAV